MYIRYRIGDRTYMTNYRVRLPKDEPVLIGFNKSSGKLVFVRERCGNLLFETKQPGEEMVAAQPAPKDLEEVGPGPHEKDGSLASPTSAAAFSSPDAADLDTGTPAVNDGMFLTPLPGSGPETEVFAANYAGDDGQPVWIGAGALLASGALGKTKNSTDNSIDVTDVPEPTAVPEPGSFALAFVGCALALLLLKRRTSSS